MSTDMVLHGDIVDDRTAEIQALQDEVKRLRRELAMANGEIARAKTDAANALAALRQQLSPLYRALQAVFGELDSVAVDEGAPAASTDPRVSAVWASWKSRLGGQCAKVIDVLLTHGEMNTTQLGIAVGTRRQNIPNLIYKLNQAGLINKNGGRFSLKQL